MTSPINPTVIQHQGALDSAIGSFMQSYLQMQEVTMKKKQFALERQRTEAQIEASKAAGEESKARTKATLAELAQKELTLMAEDNAARSFAVLSQMPGGVSDPKNVAQVQQDMMELVSRSPHKDAGVETLAAFNAMLADSRTLATAEAQQRTAQIAAKFAEDTLAERTNAALMEPEATRLAMARDRAATTAAEASTALASYQQAGIEAEVLTRAESMYETTRQPWGVIRRTFKIPKIEGGIPDDAMYDPTATGRGGTGGEQALLAKTYYDQMVSSNELLNTLVPQSDGVTVFAAMQRALRSGGAIEGLMNAFQDPLQRQIIQASRSFSQAFRYYSSGKQTTNQEYANLMAQMTETPHDDPETIQQKRNARAIVIEGARDLAGGLADPVTLYDRMIEQATSQGQTLLVTNLKRRRTEVAEEEYLKSQGLGIPPLRNEPITDFSNPRVSSVVDSLIKAYYIPTGGN